MENFPFCVYVRGNIVGFFFVDAGNLWLKCSSWILMICPVFSSSSFWDSVWSAAELKVIFSFGCAINPFHAWSSMLLAMLFCFIIFCHLSYSGAFIFIALICACCHSSRLFCLFPILFKTAFVLTSLEQCSILRIIATVISVSSISAVITSLCITACSGFFLFYLVQCVHG